MLIVESRQPRLGIMAIALAATLWAIAAVVASQLFQAGITPIELTTARTVIAAVGLAGISRSPQSVKTWADWRILALGASLALVTVTYYVAIAHLAVAVAVVIEYTAPVLVVVFTAIQHRRRPSRQTLVAAMVALAGVGLVSGVGTHDLQLSQVGLIAAGCSAICFSSYTLFSEALVDRFGATGVMLRGFSVSSLFWLLVQGYQGFPNAIFASSNLPGVLFIGIGGTLIPFSLLCWGIQQVRAERGAIAATLEPVMSAILAWLWLGQSLTVLQVVVGLVVLLAVTVLQLRGDR